MALTSRSLYTSVKANEDDLVRDVLLLQLSRGVIENIITVRRFPRDKSRGACSTQEIVDLLASYESRASQWLMNCDIPQALGLLEEHEIVRQLSKRFAQQSFFKHMPGSPGLRAALQRAKLS
jgi:hypothetical protein